MEFYMVLTAQLAAHKNLPIVSRITWWTCSISLCTIIPSLACHRRVPIRTRKPCFAKRTLRLSCPRRIWPFLTVHRILVYWRTLVTGGTHGAFWATISCKLSRTAFDGGRGTFDGTGEATWAFFTEFRARSGAIGAQITTLERKSTISFLNLITSAVTDCQNCQLSKHGWS